MVLGHVVLGHVVLGHVVLGQVVLGHVVLGHVVLGHVVLGRMVVGRMVVGRHRGLDHERHETVRKARKGMGQVGNLSYIDFSTALEMTGA
jgi:hypothetical protein